jgi:hypothetical protein
MKKNKYTCFPIFSEEQKLALLDGFQKQNTYTTIESYAKANNVKESTLHGWSVRYRRCPVGWHHRNHRAPLQKEKKIALLDGFQKQNTHTTITDYAKANNVSVQTFFNWSVRYGMPLGGHHSRPIFSKEQRIALLEGFQKQNTYTTIAEYANAHKIAKSTLNAWSVRYGVRLGLHYVRRTKKPLHTRHKRSGADMR